VHTWPAGLRAAVRRLEVGVGDSIGIEYQGRICHQHRYRVWIAEPPDLPHANPASAKSQGYRLTISHFDSLCVCGETIAKGHQFVFGWEPDVALCLDCAQRSGVNYTESRDARLTQWRKEQAGL
jgi:hypothetical protein